MANPDRQSAPQIKRSEQYIQNASFDETYQVLAVENLGENAAGNALLRQKLNDDGTTPVTSGALDNMLTELYVENGAMAKRVYQSGTVYYIGWAAPGSNTADNAWRISKIDTSGSPEVAVTTFADGNREFDNAWDDLLSLSYS